MKRIADRQLAKGDDDEEEVEEVGKGFKKADAETLAARPIRGLPKKLGGPAPAPSPSANESVSRFGGFSGFGEKNTFSFTPPQTPTPQSSYGAAPPSQPAPSTPPNTFTPTATKTAQTIGSILQSASTTSFTPNPPPSGPSDASRTYFLNMRGLNRAFMKSIAKFLEDDPFINLADQLAQYKSHALAIEATRSTAEAAAAPKAAAPSFSKAFGANLTPASSGSASDAPTPFTFPAPTSAPSGEASKVFNFTKSAPPTGSEVKAANAFFVPKSTDAPPSSSPFSAVPAVSASPFGGALGSPFGASSASTSTASPFGAKPGTPTPSPFGAAPPAAKSSFSFGAPSAGDASKATDAPATSFFSTPPAGNGPLSGFGGFGKPAGASNPVGFGFGANKDAKPAEEATKESEGQSSQETTATEPSSEALAGMVGTGAHDEEGEGEQDEDTTFSLKLKAFKLNKDSEGKSNWTELGVGVLRLKKHKETDARRMLLRNSSSGKIHINFNLYSGLTPNSPNKKSVSFVGHDEQGAAVSYLLRTKSEDQTADLKNALEREITFVKAKDA